MKLTIKDSITQDNILYVLDGMIMFTTRAFRTLIEKEERFNKLRFVISDDIKPFLKSEFENGKLSGDVTEMLRWKGFKVEFIKDKNTVSFISNY